MILQAQKNRIPSDVCLADTSSGVVAVRILQNLENRISDEMCVEVKPPVSGAVVAVRMILQKQENRVPGDMCLEVKNPASGVVVFAVWMLS